MASLAPFDHEFLVVDDDVQVLEGASEHPRMVIIKFKSRGDAEQWYHSQEYDEARSLRLAASEGVGVLVDHWEPPTG